MGAGPRGLGFRGFADIIRKYGDSHGKKEKWNGNADWYVGSRRGSGM